MTPGEPSDPGAGGADQPRRRVLGQWLRLGFLGLVIAFGAVFVASRWDELSTALAKADWRPVVGSVFLGAAGLVASLMAWRALLIDFGSSLSVRIAGRVFFLGQLGKYLPGSVWSVLAQAEMGRAHRVPRTTTLVVSLLSLVLSVGVGSVFAVVLLSFSSTEAMSRYWWVVLVIPLFVVALHPKVLGWGLELLFRLLGRGELQQRPSYLGMVRAAGWQSLAWVLLGLHAWLLVVAFGGEAWRGLAVGVGGFALAFCIGLIFIPVPAGAGVRDAALTVALSPVLAAPEALAVALTSRLALVFLDFGLAAGAWALMRRARSRTEPASLSQIP